MPFRLLQAESHCFPFQFYPVGQVRSQTPVVIRIVVYDIQLFVQYLDLVQQKVHPLLRALIQILIRAPEVVYVLAQNVVKLFDIPSDHNVEIFDQAVLLPCVPAEEVEIVSENRSCFHEVDEGKAVSDPF